MKEVWWIHPGKLQLFFLLPVYLFVVFVVPRAWPELVVLKAGYYIRGAYAWFGAAVLVSIGIFALIGARVSIDRREAGSSIALHPKILGTIGALAIAAYIIWFYPALLSGSFMADRQAMNQTPGITSFTQLGVPFIVAYLSATLTEGVRYGRIIRLQFWLLMFLTAVRVQLWSERLAMIEVGVPIAILVLSHRVPRSWFGRAVHYAIRTLGPFLGIPALLAVFTLTEFFRSWTVYSRTQQLPLLEFMTSRLITYYFTALNNGAGMLATTEGRWPTFDFHNLAEWAYRLPMGIGASLETMTRQAEPAAGIFLTRWADIEFNNMSGIFPIVYDVGHLGALLYFCGLGFVAGVLHRSMRAGRALGLFYPPVYVGLLEVMRHTYLNNPRIVLIFAGTVLAYVSIRVSRAGQVRRFALAGAARPSA